MRFNQLNERSSLPLSQEVSDLLGRGDTVYIQIDDTDVAEVVGVNLDKDKRTVIVGFGKSRKSIPVHNDTYRIDDSEGYNVIRKIEENIQEIPMTNKKINEGLLSEEEETGVMAKYTLYMIAKSATRLHKLIQDEEAITPEVLDLLQAALSSVNTVKMDYDDIEEAVTTTPRSGAFSTPRSIRNMSSVVGNVNKPEDARWEAARAAKAKAKPAKRGLSALFAGDTNSVITRQRTEMAADGSVGHIYKDGVDQGMYDIDTLADTLFFNDQNFDSFEDVAAALGGEFSWDASALLDNVTEAALYETEDRPYVVFHNKKGRYETHAATSFEAAKQAAAHWKLKSTAGVSAHAADVEHVAEQASSMFESAKKKAKLKAKK
mgnify:FL=1|tara:strand:- start:1101 stop:2228 length:1128 start_codon:yes stop_codon:yes gene_type:complete